MKRESKCKMSAVCLSVPLWKSKVGADSAPLPRFLLYILSFQLCSTFLDSFPAVCFMRLLLLFMCSTLLHLWILTSELVLIFFSLLHVPCTWY